MLKLEDYIFTPKDVWNISKKIVRRVLHCKKRDWIYMVILVFVIIIEKYYFQFDLESIIFWAFTIILFWWRLDSRVPIVLALFCLIAIPILLSLFNGGIFFEGDEWAEVVAVWAYYFLVIGVIEQIFEYRTEAKLYPKKNTDDEVEKDRKNNINKINIKTKQRFDIEAPRKNTFQVSDIRKI